MFFIFSKLLLFLILPLTWISVFLIVALVAKKPSLKRRSLIIAAILLLIFTNPFLLNSFARLWDIKPVPLKKTGSYSSVIVLGGFSGEDADGKGFFNTAADRFIQGLKLFSEKKADHILISGGNGNLINDGFTESGWTYTQLREFNVPDSSILLEDKSRNTIENAAFTKKVLADKHLQPPYILVTSAFHMRRSLGIFKNAGLDVIPYPCNYFAGNGKFTVTELLPDVSMLAKWEIYIKEVFGVAVNLIREHI